MVTVWSVVALAAASGWFIFQIDVHNAFLQGDLLEEVYMQIPDGFASQGECHQKKACRLHKSLYGLKQAPRQMNLKLTSALKDMGFVQSHYDYSLFTQKVSELGLASGKPIATPLEFNHKLTSVAFDEFMNKEEASIDAQLEDPGSYQRLVGRLLYLTMTRLDIAFVVQVLSQHMHAPKQSHMEAAIRVVKYIKRTAGLGLFMPAKSNKELVAYCDSDWGSCVETRKSITGYIVKFGEAVISWKSKKQSTVSKSSAE
uniref:Uncharacterized mitochondrial protein AtMg00810-like n=1 Tax=Nicotiana tabacum TaxID=4097 RepID=A0A1S3YQ57_TOBAC|nr:PREDICTED: uncharacterized mitochondrial protein AtMg00810-like [Nicotiana tabacum]